MEIKILLGGNHFPTWKSKSPMEETVFQLGNQNPPWRKSFSSLEIEILHNGNVPPIWRTKIIMMEMFLRFGGGKSSWWKRSSNLEEENHRDGNVPQIWRKKIIVVLWSNSKLSKAKKPYQAINSRLFYVFVRL